MEMPLVSGSRPTVKAAMITIQPAKKKNTPAFMLHSIDRNA